MNVNFSQVQLLHHSPITSDMFLDTKRLLWHHDLSSTSMNLSRVTCSVSVLQPLGVSCHVARVGVTHLTHGYIDVVGWFVARADVVIWNM